MGAQVQYLPKLGLHWPIWSPRELRSIGLSDFEDGALPKSPAKRPYNDLTKSVCAGSCQLGREQGLQDLGFNI